MWFFTLALLIVAGYLIYDALRDRSAMKQSHELSSAQRPAMGTSSNAPHRYTNTSEASVDSAELTHVSGDPRAATSASSDTTALAGLSATGLAAGSSRARNAISELWHDSKSKRQPVKADAAPQQGSDRVSDAAKDAQVGTRRSIDSVAETLRHAKTRLRAESELKKNTEMPAAGIGAGFNKFKHSVSESVSDAGTKRRKALEAVAEQGEPTTLIDTLKTGSKRFKDTLLEPWEQSPSLLAKPGSDAIVDTTGRSQVGEGDSDRLPGNVSSIRQEITDAGHAGKNTVPSASGDGASGAQASRIPATSGSIPATQSAPLGTSSETAKVKTKRKFLEQPEGKKDDLTKVKGIGPVIEGHLNEMGIYHFHQLASINQADIDYINEELDFPGRIERDNWIEQATKLSASRPTAKT